MIVTVDHASISLSDPELKRFSTIIQDDNPAAIHRALVSAMRHILNVCSPDSQQEPILLDPHVFVANKMLEDEGAPIDHASIQATLKAWSEAESSLVPNARKALRLVAPLCTLVLRAKDKKVFDEEFDAQLLPRLPPKAATFLRSYIEAVIGWLGGSAPPGANAHYLENMVYHVHTSIVIPIIAEKGDSFVQKRLAAAKSALDAFLFD